MTTRRSFLQTATALGLALPLRGELAALSYPAPLQEFAPGDVHLGPGLAYQQFVETQTILMGLDEDSLLKPWRLRAGLPAPGADLGGWYDEVPPVPTPASGHGYAPGHCFGQWLSALARGYAATGDARVRNKVDRLVDLYDTTVSPRFYRNFRYPAYNYDKLVLGLLDAARFAGVSNAFAVLDRTTEAALPSLPPTALDRGEPQRQWHIAVGENETLDHARDEPYTLPENLFLASEAGAGQRYRLLAERFLLDKTFFDPLAAGIDVLADHHAYSYFNALNSAMMAYLSGGSRKHLQAARVGFDLVQAQQSFATGGWGPDEAFHAANSSVLYDSLSTSHCSFETPCGSWAHMKLTRYLLRTSVDGRYGDSLERVLYNTVLGAEPLQADGRSFYYSDYHQPGQRTYFQDRWPCCAGTLPQVAADYARSCYLHDLAGLYVNLYLPSTVRWTAPDGALVTLTQEGNYPMEEDVAFRLRLSASSAFALRLRIPAWSRAAGEPVSLRVNGTRVPFSLTNGFATLRQKWKDGDRIDLRLPMDLRLEAIDKAHPDCVALLRGPLVLFALAETPPAVTAAQLLRAKRLSGQNAWQASTGGGEIRFAPFTEVQHAPYLTYLKVS